MIAPLLLLSRKLPSFCHQVLGFGRKIVIFAAKCVIPVQNFEVVILFSLL